MSPKSSDSRGKQSETQILHPGPPKIKSGPTSTGQLRQKITRRNQGPIPDDCLPIETPRLMIRKLQHHDMEDYFEIFSDFSIAEFDDYEILNRADLIEVFEKYRTVSQPVGHQQGEKGECQDGNTQATHFDTVEYGVELKENRKIVGILTILLKAGRPWIGYHFNRAWHGKGLAFECVDAFKKVSRKRLWGRVDIRNHPSIRLLHKCGFTYVKDTRNSDGLPEHVYVFDPPGSRPGR